MAGKSESIFRAMIKANGWAWHKYGDVRYCIYCHKPLPKSELMPDYLVCLKPIWVEVKNNDSSGRWSWASDIGPDGARKAQRQFLIDNDGFLFIELGIGRHPTDFSAYLIPMREWVRIEPDLLTQQASLAKDDTKRTIGADTILAEWRLAWERGTWVIPKGHVWWYHLHSLTTELLHKIEEML